ncbi:phage tail tube protein [Phytohabitans aurantiacus]|uniref:IPT/TIG domain-containing protein n=1 Tax=Phytohabitans aurantiacus TaxID=3016789 RepID=A0ABQ5QSG4_9ACTN|nr:IPT/TIG domain-containing protein [Phytohabitans aurantiacus]GLH97344.1 hypothetical protein Pa4123_26190 [Phytohabitans aurantiacus]
MATTPTTRVTDLAREYRIDIDTATFPAVAYNQLMGIEDAKLIEELRTEEDENYEDDGAGRETNTGYKWRIEGKLAYSTNLAGTLLDPIHAFLRTQFKKHRTMRVEQAEFGVRFYHRSGIDSGHDSEGRVFVKTWTPPGGKGRNVVDVVLQGQGALADIVNPLANLDPVVTGLDPATGAAAGGNLVNIYGQHFTDATDVDFGVAAAVFEVVNDGHIVAVAPAVAASTVNVSVTTAEGTSATGGTADNYVYV